MFIASTLILLNLYARIIIATLQYVWFFHQFWPLKIVTSFMDRPQAWMFFDDLVTTTNIRKPFTAIHWSNERRRARKSGAGSFTYLLSDLIFFLTLLIFFELNPFCMLSTRFKMWHIKSDIFIDLWRWLHLRGYFHFHSIFKKMHEITIHQLFLITKVASFLFQ